MERGRAQSRRGFQVGPALCLATLLALCIVASSGRPAQSATGATTNTSAVDGPPGAKLTVHGAGFAAGETVVITLDGRFMATSTVGTSGSFAVATSIPTLALPGSHALRAAGRSSGASSTTTFFVHADWSGLRRDAASSGSAPFEALIDSVSARRLAEQWTGVLGASTKSSVVVADSMVFIGANNGNLYAFDAACGVGGAVCAPKWVGPTGGISTSTPLVLNHVVYVGSTDGRLYAFDEACGAGGSTCAPRFTAATGGPIIGSPTGDGGLVFVGSTDKYFYAFAASCTDPCLPNWKATMTGAASSTAAVSGTRVYVGSNTGKVYAFATTCGSGGATCAPIWTATTGGATGSPAVNGTRVFVTSGDGKIYAFSTTCASGGAACSALWKGGLGGPSATAPAVSGTTVYATSSPPSGSSVGHLTSFDIACGTSGATCSARMYLSVNGNPSAPVVAADAVWTTTAGVVAGYATTCTWSCMPFWTRTMSSSASPIAISDGVLYVPTVDGMVHAFGTKPSTFFVSPSGNDASAGTSTAPWRSVGAAITRLLPGDKLYVRAGTYVESVKASVRRASSEMPIIVASYPGEHPVIQGLFWLTHPDHWKIAGLNVTWTSSIGQSSDHMVKLIDGVGWTLRYGELSGARSYAALLVAGDIAHEPADWTVTGNCIHDTYPTNGPNQDQLIYVNTGLSPGPGSITHNLLFNATNGMGVKLGGPTASSGGAAYVTVANNTIYNTAQSLMVSWQSHDNVIDHDILDKVANGYGNIRGYELSGLRNVATYNAGYDAAKLILNDPGYQGVATGAGNTFPQNPSFDSVTSCAGFHSGNPALNGFGR